MAEKRSLDIPPVYFVVSLVLMVFLHQAVPLARVLAAPYRYAGIVIVALAAALVLWAALLFRRAGTGIVPFSPSTALVLRGPYRFTRNPMYLGMAGTLLGVAVLMGSITPFFVIPAFMAALTERFILREEEHLERAFDGDFLAYKQKVRRWL